MPWFLMRNLQSFNFFFLVSFLSAFKIFLFVPSFLMFICGIFLTWVSLALSCSVFSQLFESL